MLALDKDGTLVVIENKLNDSGKDVTWQALKYASYCSSLSKEEIRSIFQDYLIKTGSGGTAEKLLSEFFEKEYDEIVLNKGTDTLRVEFWTALLKEMAKKSELFRNINPNKDSWLSAGSGISGVAFSFCFSKVNTRAELYIDMGIKEDNKKLFDYLHENKNDIESVFGEALNWERLEDRKASRIISFIDKGCYDKENWASIIPEITNRMVIFEKALKEHLKNTNALPFRFIFDFIHHITYKFRKNRAYDDFCTV